MQQHRPQKYNEMIIQRESKTETLTVDIVYDFCQDKGIIESYNGH